MSSYALPIPRGIDVFFEGTSAVGAAGQLVTRELRKVQQEATARASNWSVSVDSAIAEIARDCCQANCDGYGAPPTKVAALKNARELAAALFEILPTGVPAPDVVPEIDGDVSLSWTRDRLRGISVSVSDHDRLSFAGILDKGAQRHGVEIFDGSDRRVLQEIAQYIARLYGR
jgi:hypothetical protein